MEIVVDHDCPLRAIVIAQQEEITVLTKRLGELERRLFGKKSEKMPPPARELRKEETPEEVEARNQASLAKRRANAALKKTLRKETVLHKVADADKACPKCGGTADRGVGDGKHTTVIEYVPGQFMQREHVQETLACRCGQHIVTAPPAPRPLDNSLYGPGFIAYVITMKCADSIPLYRLAKQFQRIGVSVVRSTLNDLFHGAATKLAPLYERLLELIAAMEIVQADETPLVMQRPNRKGYVWTFLADKLIAYRFSGSRSGDTPAEVLGGTKGALVVDAYTGYNAVTLPDGRVRAGCIAHMRRGFFDAVGTAPEEARHALELILEVYRVEHEARARGIVRTAEHLALRQSRSRKTMDTLHAWLLDEQPKHLPKGPMGQAIGYALNQWLTLTRFVDDAGLPVDNNRSEAALRIVALGRKNFLFVGDEDCGENLYPLHAPRPFALRPAGAYLGA